MCVSKPNQPVDIKAVNGVATVDESIVARATRVVGVISTNVVNLVDADWCWWVPIFVALRHRQLGAGILSSSLFDLMYLYGGYSKCTPPYGGH